MGVKDGLPRKLLDRVEPFLEENERVKQVFMARSGVGPKERTVNPVTMLRRAGNHIFVITNKGTTVLDATILRSTVPTGVGLRSRKAIHLVQMDKLWAEITLDGETYWVHKRFFDEVEEVAR